MNKDIRPAHQLRTYGWNAKLPLSILTDFEEFAIYDTRQKPNDKDNPKIARVAYYNFEEYIDKWDEIEKLLSKDAINNGSLDEYAQKSKRKGTLEVDDSFLNDMEEWRKILARNIAIRNESLSVNALNEAVQKTIDRIIFLRICEDRGIETFGQLEKLIKTKDVYYSLKEIFLKADTKYNSGLFNFRKEKDSKEPDTWTLDLIIDDKVLKEILKKLYFPSPYAFSVMPADILGQVYERFLGSTVYLTETHRAKVDRKPEVQKAGGVYYTPTYIVEYIVNNTVGKLLENKSIDEVKDIKILDPASGSGSFLIGAYQYLLDWYLDKYSHNPNNHSKGNDPAIYEVRQNEYFLTINEKKRILLNHIHGVDIDYQAVEVTKLSLLLKVLEGETEETLGLNRQYKMEFSKRALPDLRANIKCGNSLIGSDFYDNANMELFNDNDYRRINVFDWEKEFPEVFAKGGFDAIIGNPPWISLTGKFKNDIYTSSEIEYLTNKYQANTYMPYIYEYFVNKGLILCNNNAYFSFIVPDRFGYNSQFIGLRKRILEKYSFLKIVYKLPFPNITADTMVFIITTNQKQKYKNIVVSLYNNDPIIIYAKNVIETESSAIKYYKSSSVFELIIKISNLNKIENVSKYFNSTSGFGGKSNLITDHRIEDQQIKIYKGNCIEKYSIKKHLWFNFKRTNITGRTTDKIKIGSKHKILIRKTGSSIIAVYDDSGIFPEQSLYFLFNKTTDMD